jgi:hypothetical protein
LPELEWRVAFWVEVLPIRGGDEVSGRFSREGMQSRVKPFEIALGSAIKVVARLFPCISYRRGYVHVNWHIKGEREEG